MLSGTELWYEKEIIGHIRRQASLNYNIVDVYIQWLRNKYKNVI